MTVEQMAIVLHHSKTSGTAKVVLLGIANHDGDGGAFPSIDTLGDYANKDDRSVQRAINAAVALGELRVHRQDGGFTSTPDYLRPNRYEILLRCPEDCDRSANHMTDAKRAKREARRKASVHRGDGTVTPLRPGVIHRGDSSVTGGGDKNVTGGVTKLSPKPSLEPSLGTSGPPSTGTSPATEVMHSAARSIEEDQPLSGRRGQPADSHDNARRRLDRARDEWGLRIPVDYLLDEAYRIGSGDPWLGAIAMLGILQAEYPGARNRDAVIRKALRDVEPARRHGGASA